LTIKPNLSVIIVSYNAKYYLHLTLSCLTKMSESLGLEIIVVDNASNTGVTEFMQSAFPQVNFIFNEKNLGFSKANNLGVKLAVSDQILILNPDTIINEIVIQKALALLSDDAGAVAVKMMDGKGDYLPESARGFPDLKSSFLKMLGFKKSSNYYMEPDADHCIEVMSGACMLFNKAVYNEIGGLDERYFMYGEDIDISYQMSKAGKRIKYIDSEEIIHFKGRSSVKSNWRYQTAFYNAMKLYWQKNFQWGQQPLL
jgi:GT2 family glycosyltransferase